MFKVTKIAIQVIENFDELIFSFLSKLLPWVVAAGPAMILGWTASRWAAGAGIAEKEAGWIGMAIGVAIVVAGAVNAHLAIRYAEAWILVVLTIGLEILGLFLTGSDTEPWVGTVAALVQGIVYVGRAWANKDSRDENRSEEDRKRQQEAEDRDWELKKAIELKKLDEQTRVKLAKIEAEKEAKIIENNEKSLKVSENLQKEVDNLPDWLPRAPKNKKDFLRMAKGGEVPIYDISAQDLFEAGIVGTERTGYNWLNEAKNEHKENGHV